MGSAFVTRASKGGDGAGFERAPAGNHPAALVALVELGHQWEDGYQGQPARWVRKVYLAWELLGVKVSGADRNHVVGCSLTHSLNERATLRKFIQARVGKTIPDGDYDLSVELGQPCLLSVVEKNGYPRVDTPASVPAALVATFPKPTYKPLALSLADIRGGATVPDWLPYVYGKSVADTVRASREVAGDTPPAFRGAQPGPAVGGAGEVPF